MNITKDIKLIKVEYPYQMEISDNKRKIIFIPTLEIKSAYTAVLIADLCIDGLEVMPSAKINLNEGKNKLELQDIVVFQHLFNDQRDIRTWIYNMELRLFPEGIEFVKDIKEIVIDIKSK